MDYTSVATAFGLKNYALICHSLCSNATRGLASYTYSVLFNCPHECFQN